MIIELELENGEIVAFFGHGGYVWADLNGKPGVLGTQLCEAGQLAGHTLQYLDGDKVSFEVTCKNWLAKYEGGESEKPSLSYTETWDLLDSQPELGFDANSTDEELLEVIDSFESSADDEDTARSEHWREVVFDKRAQLRSV